MAVVGQQVRVHDVELVEGVGEARDQHERQRSVTFQKARETLDFGGSDEDGQGEYEDEEGAVEELGEVEDGLVGGAVADDDAAVEQEEEKEEGEGGDVGGDEPGNFEHVAHHQDVLDERGSQ